jgi:hypothetical protein
MPEPDWFHWEPSSQFPSPSVASPTTQSCSLWCTRSDNIETWSPINSYMLAELWVIRVECVYNLKKLSNHHCLLIPMQKLCYILTLFHKYIHLLICGLCNDTASSSHYTVLNNKMINNVTCVRFPWLWR